MQIQATGQAQPPAQMQQIQTHNQIRKMDGSGNGQGLRNGSNATTTASPLSSVPLPDNSTFSTFA
jgi:hypothetical protein